MLSVDKNWRKRGIGLSSFSTFFPPSPDILQMNGEIHQLWCGLSCFFFLFFSASTLVRNSIDAMKEDGVEEVRLLIFLFPSHRQRHSYRSSWKRNSITMLLSLFTNPLVSYVRNGSIGFISTERTPLGWFSPYPLLIPRTIRIIHPATLQRDPLLTPDILLTVPSKSYLTLTRKMTTTMFRLVNCLVSH